MTTVVEPKPYTILIAALGGEGGSVLMNWIVAAARSSGLPVQATSVPGVAQRTGATSYYIEMFPTPAPDGRSPVFALMPMSGRIDVVLASELVEAGRMMERGFVSPTRTTLIASTSRVYSTAEKIEMGDGRFASDKVHAAAGKLSRRFVSLDLEQLAKDNSTMISATMLGALAGADVLPIPVTAFESAIGGGRAASRSLAGFRAAFLLIRNTNSGDPTDRAGFERAALPSPAASTADPRLVTLPTGLRNIAAHGLERTVDFMDTAYGDLYLERVRRLVLAANSTDPQTTHALIEAARRLALWMAYEDVPRVAELKVRPERFARIRRESEVGPHQVLHVVEYLKPGAEEVAAMLPASLGRAMMRRISRGKSVPFLGRGIHLRSTSISGNLILRMLASFKHVRRRSLRYVEEQAAIETWLAAMTSALQKNPSFAAALAELPRLLKGYSDTHMRGRRAYATITTTFVEPALAAGTLSKEDTVRLRRATAAALADPEHRALQSMMTP